jgi:preprotein translocase subunit SecF
MFSLSLMVGIVAGAYSSIFIASPLLVLYQEWQERKEIPGKSK